MEAVVRPQQCLLTIQLQLLVMLMLITHNLQARRVRYVVTGQHVRARIDLTRIQLWIKGPLLQLLNPKEQLRLVCSTRRRWQYRLL